MVWCYYKLLASSRSDEAMSMMLRYSHIDYRRCNKCSGLKGEACEDYMVKTMNVEDKKTVARLMPPTGLEDLEDFGGSLA